MASQAVTTVDSIKGAVARMAPEFKAALPAHIPVEKFIRVAQTAILSNPDLQQADRHSLFAACTKLAQDGLLADGREAALVIFNAKDGNGWIKKVQAMPMIAGILKKIRQSGEVASIDCHVVYENDNFTYRPGIDTQPIFEPNWFGDRGKPIGAYAIAVLKTGEIIPPEIMNVEQIEKVRNVSRAKDKGPWVEWWGEMARKTVMRRYAKRLPSNTDLEEQIFSRDATMETRPIVIQPEQSPAAPISRLDALEHHIEDEGSPADAIPAAHQSEGPDDTQRGEAHTDAADYPLKSDVEVIKARIAGSRTPKDLGNVETEYLAIAVSLPQSVADEIEGLLTDKRNAMKAVA